MVRLSERALGSAARELCSLGAPRSSWRDLRSVPPNVYCVIWLWKASFPPPNNLYPSGPVPLYLSAGGQTLGSKLRGSAFRPAGDVLVKICEDCYQLLYCFLIIIFAVLAKASGHIVESVCFLLGWKSGKFSMKLGKQTLLTVYECVNTIGCCPPYGCGVLLIQFQGLTGTSNQKSRAPHFFCDTPTGAKVIEISRAFDEEDPISPGMRPRGGHICRLWP